MGKFLPWEIAKIDQGHKATNDAVDKLVKEMKKSLARKGEETSLAEAYAGFTMLSSDQLALYFAVMLIREAKK